MFKKAFDSDYHIGDIVCMLSKENLKFIESINCRDYLLEPIDGRYELIAFLSEN